MLKQNLELDFLLSSYRYNLPETQIAQYPKERGTSRLLVMDKYTGEVSHRRFTSLSQYLPKGALLVANNTQVLPVRITGLRHTGGRFEFLLLTPVLHIEQKAKESFKQKGWCTAEAELLVKPSKKFSVGEIVTFYDDLLVHFLKREDFGRYTVQLSWRGSLKAFLFRYGQVPLPPYIQRKGIVQDREAYQTLYAKEVFSGAVAAPTAGLHFSAEHLEQLKTQGFSWAELTLHVGYGTFSPVRTQDIREHEMHREYVQIPQETIDAIQRAKKESRKVIAIGTTVVRALEGLFTVSGKLVPYNGWINTFIKPGYSFHVVDGIITNFHQPESTLLMLVSAFVGRERLLKAYEEAVQQGYRFFSYGDAMFIR